MSECKVYRREFEGAADGGALSADARAHASLCRACGEELRASASLRALVGGLGKVEAPADFEFRLRARMAREQGPGGRGRFAGVGWVYGFAPVAAAACFVVISATLYFRQAARPTPAGQPPSAVESARNGGNPEATPAAVGLDVTGEVEVGRETGSIKHRSHTPPARGRAQGVEVASRIERRARAARNAAVFSLEGARVLEQEGVITLRSSAEPLRMIMRDERGAERVVPMKTVSFGSQDLLAREAALGQTNAVKVEGVW
jgi:hypothetical protein